VFTAVMSSKLQTLLSLLIVLAAAVWLLRRAFSKNAKGGCASGECSALSPSVKKLKRKIRAQ